MKKTCCMEVSTNLLNHLQMEIPFPGDVEAVGTYITRDPHVDVMVLAGEDLPSDGLCVVMTVAHPSPGSRPAFVEWSWWHGGSLWRWAPGQRLGDGAR